MMAACPEVVGAAMHFGDSCGNRVDYHGIIHPPNYHHGPIGFVVFDCRHTTMTRLGHRNFLCGVNFRNVDLHGRYIDCSVDTLLPLDHQHLNIDHCLGYDDWIDLSYNDYALCCDNARLDESSRFVDCYARVRQTNRVKFCILRVVGKGQCKAAREVSLALSFIGAHDSWCRKFWSRRLKSTTDSCWSCRME